MSALEKLQEIQEKNKSLICLGLDLDVKRMPAENSKSIKGMYEFAMKIIEATSDKIVLHSSSLRRVNERLAPSLHRSTTSDVASANDALLSP